MMSYQSTPPVNSETYEHYLKYIGDLDMSPKEKFELLYIVHSMMSYFVEQAFGIGTDQITLKSVGKTNFRPSLDHATIQHHFENQTADVQSHGVEGDSNPLGTTKP